VMDDRIGDILVRADAAAGRSATHRDLAERVRAETRRRLVRGRVLCAVAVVLVAWVVAGPLLTKKHVPDAVVVKGDGRMVEQLRREIAALRAEAEARERVVALMLDLERRPRAVEARRVADPVERIRAQQDLAALALVRQADRFYRELDRKESAAAKYEQVMALFPDSSWAAVARQRLMEIN
jgi:hypothetical protein